MPSSLAFSRWKRGSYSCGGVFEQERYATYSRSPKSSSDKSFTQSNGRNAIFSLSTAKPVTKANGRIAYWDGVLYPAASDTNDGYLATDVERTNVTAFNEGHRELINATVLFDGRSISLLINGDLAVSQELDEVHELVTQKNVLYLGGRGGDFRELEAVHWSWCVPWVLRC